MPDLFGLSETPGFPAHPEFPGYSDVIDDEDYSNTLSDENNSDGRANILPPWQKAQDSTMVNSRQASTVPDLNFPHVSKRNDKI